jgi:hypothetical protein
MGAKGSAGSKWLAVCASGLVLAGFGFVVGQANVGAAESSALALRGVDPIPPGPKSIVPLDRGTPASGSAWQTLPTPPFDPGLMFVLTDGTVIEQDNGPSNNGTGAWWRLTPDDKGSYVNGSWSKIASMPSGYAPLYYASAVLPDGRFIVEGGEYNAGKLKWTNLGAIYDPLTNKWTSVAHPTGSQWTRIGDAPGAVLANGKFMLGASGYSTTTAQAILKAGTLTWTATGAGKADGNGEEGWSLLPNGDLLTVDADNKTSPRNTELYNPSTGRWSSAGVTPKALADTDGEVGPQLLRPNGTVFAVGASGYNAVYNTTSHRWSNGPKFPIIGGLQYDVADGPGAVLSDGNVLVDASPGVYKKPAHFFVFNGTTLTQVADAPNANNQSSYYGKMVVLPTGQVLFNDGLGDLEVYNNGGSPQSTWRPHVTSVPTSVVAGGSYTVSGTQLNGLTQGAAYGDDYQSATNFPLVRITNTATGDVAYARTSGMTAMSVAPNASSSATFTLPAGIETGASSLVVVANGIASAPVPVTVS